MARYGYGYGRGYGYGGWAPYVPVAIRRRQAQKKMNALRKQGVDVQPVTIAGRQIATSFWGDAWCEHLESFSDYENRLPRGRTYVRNGSVCHLAVGKGKIDALVMGSDLYTVTVKIKTLPATKWRAIKQRSSGQIGSLLELLQGRLSDQVMEIVTDPKGGLFPLPGEMSFGCSCPDWADMCKHVAAVLYGIGARLDSQPELLFVLRGVNHQELIDADAERAVAAATSGGKSKRLAGADLGDLFGIELADQGAAPPAAPPTAARRDPAHTTRSRAAGSKAAANKRARGAAAAKPATVPSKSRAVEPASTGTVAAKKKRGRSAEPAKTAVPRTKGKRGSRER